jgi:hypothetical protein
MNSEAIASGFYEALKHHQAVPVAVNPSSFANPNSHRLRVAGASRVSTELFKCRQAQ